MRCALVTGVQTCALPISAAISGVATRWMAREDADTMALIGSGKQAMLQVAAVAAVRPLRRLKVFSPTESRRQDFVARASAAFAFAVEEAPTIADATRDAGIEIGRASAEEKGCQYV